MTGRTADPPSRDPEILAIVGQRAGVGATAAAVSLAMALTAAGRRVLLLDLDPQGRAGRNLIRGAHGGGDTGQALREAAFTRDCIAATELPDLFLAPAGPELAEVERELELMGDSRTRLHQALATLPDLPYRFDDVVIDCPPGLGLLTLNALTAAHRILLPLPGESRALDDLPTVLQTIGRLRAGLSQPLRGVHLMAAMRTPDPESRTLIDALRREYADLMLMTEIPFDELVPEADDGGKPLLARGLSLEIVQAYLALAAEWLTLDDPGQRTDGAWRFRSRPEAMQRLHDRMRQRLQAWLLDPSSLLHDPEEAARHRDGPALATLIQPARPARSKDRPRRRWPLVLGTPALLLLALLASLPLFTDSGAARWRIALGAALIGADNFWEAGSLLLARADERAYRELLLAARLIENNRARLLDCADQARTGGGTVTCTLEVPAP